MAYIPSSQPAARQPPKRPDVVLAEAEQQWIFSEEELLQTPSIVAGMTPERERELRSKGVNFINQVGAMLKLPQVTLSTASIFFHRLLVRHPLDERPGKGLHHYQAAGTAIFLATKVEENCRKIKDLVIACVRVAQKNPNMLVDEQTKEYWRWKDMILLTEDVLLEKLCFDLTIDSPYRVFFDMIRACNMHHDKKLRNAAWSFLNDSHLTQLCLLFTSRTIAAAAVYCGAKHAEVAIADDERGRPWWEVLHVRLRDVRRACNYMADIYENAPLKSGGQSIYVGLRTPEDADPLDDNTRLRSLQAMTTPISGDSTTMERSDSTQSLKRGRDEDTGKMDSGAEVQNGHVHEPAVKRAKLEEHQAVNGFSRVPRAVGQTGGIKKDVDDNGGAKQGNGAAQQDEEASEEGELEE